jgi:hypothetical protein
MIDHNQILPNLYTGTHPETLEGIQELKDRCGITAVLNLKTDEDLRERGIDCSAMGESLEGWELRYSGCLCVISTSNINGSTSRKQ